MTGIDGAASGDRRAGDRPARLMVIEDRLAFSNHLLRSLKALDPDRRASAVPHTEFLALDAWRAMGPDDIVLLDACDVGQQQEHPARSRLSALDICDQLGRLREPPTVYAYSVSMDRPEVNIPIREHPFVRAAFDHTSLLESLPEVMAGPVRGTISPPTAEDYRLLGVPPTARVAAAHQLMRSRADAWDLVWQRHHPAPAARTRAWINTHVRLLLDLPEGSYRRAVSVIQRVAGLPQ